MRKLLPVFLILLLLLPAMGCEDFSESTLPPSAGPIEPTVPENSEEPGDPTPPEINHTFEAHFIDVGQGDAILLKLPAHNILIDGGPRNSNVVQYLKDQGVQELDLVVATHPHADHISGLIDVLKTFPVKEVLDPAVPHTTKTFEEYLTTIDELDIKFTEAQAGMKYQFGDTRLDVLHPDITEGYSLNNVSVVVKATHGKARFLFTGDIEKEVEAALLSKDIEAEILKISHHGSASSSTVSFIDKVDPMAGVIMVGADSDYGHPTSEVLNRLQTRGIRVYRTDQNGTVVFKTDGNALDIITER